jgi:hypothetical protein
MLTAKQEQIMHDVMKKNTEAALDRVKAQIEAAKVIPNAVGQAEHIAALEAARTKIEHSLRITKADATRT